MNAHTPRSEAMSSNEAEFRRLCVAGDVPPSGFLRIELPGYDDGFLVYEQSGAYFVSDEMCTHALVSLSQGECEDGQIFCPLHGGAFDIRTGAPTAAPCRIKLKTYAVRVENGDVYAAIP